jgi:hypothetical protein
MTFRDECKALAKKYRKATTLRNDRDALMCAVFIQVMGYDGEGFMLVESRYHCIEKRMRWLDKRV